MKMEDALLLLFSAESIHTKLKPMKRQQETASSSTPIDESSAGPSNVRPHYEMKQNRKFVNVAFFVKSLQNLNNHGGDVCNFSDMHISGETKNGWNAGIQLSCRICLTTVVVWMDEPGGTSVSTQPLKPPTSAGTTTVTLPLIAEKAPAKKRKTNCRKTPTPPPDPSALQPFLAPRSLAKPHLLSQSNIPHQDRTDNPSHSINQPLIKQTPFIKQEIVLPEDVARLSKNQVPPLLTQPAAVQLLFYVEPSGSAQNSNIAWKSSAVTATPGDGDGQNLEASVNEAIVPDITPTKVLPVDLNLIKKEVEEEASQSMEVNDMPSVRLVPMSVTSLDRSKTLFASDNRDSSTETENTKDFSPVKMSVMASAKTYAKRSRAKFFPLISDTSGAKSSTVGSYPTSVSPQKVFQQVIPSSKEDALRQTANGDSNSIVLNLENRLNTILDDKESAESNFWPGRLKNSKLINKKKSKSAVWKYFRLPAYENRKLIDKHNSICKLCTKRVSSKSANLLNHLKLHHTLKHKKVLKLMERHSHPSIETGKEDEDIISLTKKKQIFITDSSKTLNYSKLISKSSARSPFWDYFGYPADENGLILDKENVICKICKHYLCHKQGTTSNMFHHLKLHHPSFHKALCVWSKSSASALIESDDDKVHDHHALNVITDPQDTREELLIDNTLLIRKKQICSLDSDLPGNCIAAITNFLIFTYQSLSLVEMQCFKDMVRSINPYYKIPTKKCFSKTEIPKLYNNTLDKIKQILAEVEVKDASMTADFWSSVDNTPYVAVTIHFIDPQWSLKTACLNCVSYDSFDTNTNIYIKLSAIFSKWRIDVTKVTCCTAAESLRITTVMNILKLPHITCFGHSLNVALDRTLDIYSIQKAVSKLKKLQNVISESLDMKRNLAKIQENMNMKVTYFSSACSNGWRSTLKLIQKFLFNRVQICKLLDDYYPNRKYMMPDSRDILALEDFVTNLKLFEDITTLSNENYIPASTVMPLYRKIQKSLQCRDSDTELSQHIKSEILSSVSKRYENETLKSSLWMSSLCDPRFRLSFTDNPSDIKTIALQKMASVYKDIDSDSSEQITEPQTEKKGLEKLFEFEDGSSDTDSLHIHLAQAELSKYLAMPKVNMNIDPLVWWKSNENYFPVLKTLARKYLAIQGSAVPAERFFSERGNAMVRRRAAVPPKHAETQIFLAENQKHIQFYL